MRHATGPLREAGLRFEYVLPTGSTGRSLLEADGYQVHDLPFVEMSRRKADLLRYLPMLVLNGWRLRRLARQRGASLLHLNDFYNLTGYVARWLSLGRLKVVTHVRFLPQTQMQPLARSWRWLAEHASERVVCVSEAVRAYFAADHARVCTVYDPLPAAGEQWPPYAVAGEPGAPVRLLYFSNYIRGKGQNFALAAFQLAYARNPDLRLHFVGGDMGMAKNQAFRQELESAVQAAGLGAVVHFDGFAADTEAAMKAHDIVLNFSEAESFSLTCLDALYYGIPLIASDCGGPAELFEHGRSGWLVPNRDVPAMAEAMIRLAADEALRRQFSAASRLFVRQKFAPARTYELLGACYRRVLALE
ncbi:glycosyltransferase family 4 protein [Hymenobacter sp. BT664]|uniref:Glycosyltransferase family 4 protein n=2 Tax=Hymenobacter montanus TaxID=2771359 RepID=A0A927BA91_9BACT|nr:glycosyltransferase family 4 protein [Hymenobacter montanus]MBD2766412.1 glycosyltransferase family 4 protein [Hymenobacter montanus]